MTNFINKIKSKLSELIPDRTGTTLTEYAMMLGFVALAAGVALQSAGNGTKSALDKMSFKLADSVADSSSPGSSPSPSDSPSDDDGGDDSGDDQGDDDGKGKGKGKDKGKGKGKK